MKDYADPQLQALAQGLASSDPGIRRVAVLDLVDCAEPEAAELLILALNDPDPAVRQEAAKVVDEFDAADIAEALIAALGDTDEVVRNAAAHGRSQGSVRCNPVAGSTGQQPGQFRGSGHPACAEALAHSRRPAASPRAAVRSGSAGTARGGSRYRLAPAGREPAGADRARPARRGPGGAPCRHRGTVPPPSRSGRR